MKKVIIIAILIIAQNQLMAQAQSDRIDDDANHPAIVKVEKENQERIKREKLEEANYAKRMKAILNQSYLEEVPEELKHKNKKPLDNTTPTGAPASSLDIKPTPKSNTAPKYGDLPFTDDWDKLED